jgi:hypothetical protein
MVAINIIYAGTYIVSHNIFHAIPTTKRLPMMTSIPMRVKSYYICWDFYSFLEYFSRHPNYQKTPHDDLDPNAGQVKRNLPAADNKHQS